MSASLQDCCNSFRKQSRVFRLRRRGEFPRISSQSDRPRFAHVSVVTLFLKLQQLLAGCSQPRRLWTRAPMHTGRKVDIAHLKIPVNSCFVLELFHQRSQDGPQPAPSWVFQNHKSIAFEAVFHDGYCRPVNFIG